uniref:Uncharacterized protein n=1 Tax=Nelumbo nucifera TaxID=4432 RepID=A0A822Z576_NELNU|nr:TPA_asm: hypothetical protein HUJ06_014555 [Nelumbo nucifera]
MEIASATIQTSRLLPNRWYPVRGSICSRDFSVSLSFKRNSSLASPFSCGNKGFHLSLQPIRPQQFSLKAIAGDTAAVPNDCAREEPSFSQSSSNMDIHEESTEENSELVDGQDKSELDNAKMIRVCDKLIEVFMVDKPTTTDWRRLLAFSKEWSNIRPHFFGHYQERADNESDPMMKHKLLRLGRKLKEIDEDVQRHNELLEIIRGAPSEISAVVARRRKDFTKEFFVHLHTVAESYYDNPTEQNALAKLGNTCIAAVQAYDTASESIEALNAAELKFHDIINSPSLDAACRKIDNLAEKNQLDSALVLMITKAWSAAKESNMMKDEVKDILYHLYMTARGNLQRLMPKEIRILKYLLTIKDPEEQLCALKDAFTPGDELEGKDVDCLYTYVSRNNTSAALVIFN